jgi:hypothetical protein
LGTFHVGVDNPAHRLATETLSNTLHDPDVQHFAFPQCNGFIEYDHGLEVGQFKLRSKMACPHTGLGLGISLSKFKPKTVQTKKTVLKLHVY